MADIQSTQIVAQQIPIAFGGSMDQFVLGAPVYFWYIMLMGAGIFCLAVLMLYYRYWVMDEIWGLVACIRRKKPVGLVRTRSRQAYLKSMEYIASVFTDEKDPMNKYYATALESSNSVSGAPLIDICDYYDWLQDPFINQAIVEIIDIWNNGEPNFETESTWTDGKPDPANPKHWTNNHMPHKDEEKIFDPQMFQKLLGSGRLKDYFDKTEVVTYIKGSIRIPAFFIINVSKIEQYLPRNRSSALLGGYSQIQVERLGGKEKKDGMEFLKYVAIGCTALIICGILAGLIATGRL